MKLYVKKLGIAVAATSISAVATHAAIVVSYADQAAAYTVSSTDLINGFTPVFVQAGDYSSFTNEGGTVASMTNGALVPRGDGAENYAAAGSVNGGAGVVFDLAAESNVSSVSLYFGWADSGRDNAAPFQLWVSSTVYASNLPSYSLLATTVETAPSFGGYFSRVTISNNAGDLASSVRSIYISFGNPENQWTGLGEIDVIGSAIPEPSSFAALAGLGILGFVATRRRRA